ncbi:MAG: hypothetical protein V1893_02200 [Candidatus Omnitrophota bacterium]
MKRYNVIIILVLITVGIFYIDRGNAQENIAPNPPEKAAPAETVILEDALPSGSQQEGEWIWDTNMKFSGTASHIALEKEGPNQHGLKLTNPIKIKAGSYIIQYVYLDPKSPPNGLMMKFQLSDGKETGVYWEGENEVFEIKENEDIWYIGFLPTKGEWVRLDIPTDDLDIQDKELTGISFIQHSGKVWWDKTSLSEEEASNDSLRDDVRDLDYVD